MLIHSSLGGDGGGGGNFAVLVASNDANGEQKAIADFVCDGTNDEATLDAAIAESIARSIGGGDAVAHVKLSDGTFYFQAALSITDNVLIEGTSSLGDSWTALDHATFFEKTVTGNFAMVTVDAAKSLVLRGIQFYPLNSEAIASPCIDLVTSGSSLYVDHCEFYWYGTDAPVISPANTSEVRLMHCQLEGDEEIVAATSMQVTLLFDDCYLYCDDATKYVIDGTVLTNPGELTLVQCQIDGAVRWDATSAGTSAVLVERCTVETDSGWSLNLLELTDMGSVRILDSTFENQLATAGSGIKVTNGTYGILRGNILTSIKNHGIWALDSDKMLIENNVLISYSEQTDNTYSGILLDGDTNDCFVNGNTLRSTASNNGLYGIRIDDSTCDNNTISNNDVRNSCNTQGNEISDAGTNTQGAEVLLFALSDETTAVAATGQKLSFRMPYPFCLSKVRASLSTASASGGPFTIDIEEGGVSVFTTDLLEVDDTELTSVTAVTQPNITDHYLANDAVVTMDVDDVGDGTVTGVKVSLYGWRV